MTTYETLDVLLNLFNILVVVFIAYKGYGAWKQRQSMIEKHMVARDLLKSVHLLRRKIDYVRNPFMTSGEFSEGSKNLDEEQLAQPETRRALSEINAYYNRWNGVLEVGTEFEIQKVDAQIVLGINTDSFFKEYMEIITDVRFALQSYGRGKNAAAYGQEQPFTEEITRNYMKNLIQGYSKIDGETDPIDARFEKTIKRIEKNLKPYLALDE